MLPRRDLLVTIWKWGVAAVAGAGAWTSWDVLQPVRPAGFGGRIRAVAVELVPDAGVLVVPPARTYLTRHGDEILALYWRCPHLGCRVPWCETAGEFECPCHGSFFNRVGEYRAGPSPRGMTRFPIEIEDGIVVIDTGASVPGPPPGPESIDEPPGPRCIPGQE
jgi:nitrite reductase/ring-hydroxylating ferredoxin subunit